MTSIRITEELSWLRVVFQLVAVINAGLVAYLVQSAPSVAMRVITVLVLAFGLLITMSVIVRIYYLLYTLERRHDVQ